jgi:hypothetical protein
MKKQHLFATFISATAATPNGRMCGRQRVTMTVRAASPGNCSPYKSEDEEE